VNTCGSTTSTPTATTASPMITLRLRQHFSIASHLPVESAPLGEPS
jgi:hypothetical protein